jgi:hypothetical protein
MGVQQKYQRSQEVFKQGSSDISGIWLISSGEFEISRSFLNKDEVR